jgi:hypothetical protein
VKTTPVARPPWETCCDQPHPDELEMLRDHLAHREREITRLRDQESIRAGQEAARDRDAQAAAKRAAWAHVLNSIQVYVLSEAKHDLWQVRTLLASADTHLRKGRAHDDWLWRVRETTYALTTLMQERLGDPEGANGGLIAEIRRLREAMHEQGEVLHAQHGTNSGRTCRCPGCEMTRAVELHEQEEVPQ